MGRKILVVDDEQNMRVALYEALSRGGNQVRVAENGRMALELIAKEAPDLVITDIRMPEMDGIEMLQRIKELQPALPVVIITGYATVETAVEAMKQGAVDYILKPFPVEVIEETVKKVFRNRGGVAVPADAAVAAPVSAAPAVAGPARRSEGGERTVIGRDAHFLRLLDRARAVASSKATVLVLGESGTGKEVFARFIHHVSERKAGPFVALNCAALPEGLLESELFGHEKGAFTGAVMTKKGKFELAHGGTLLLDEIGEIPLHLQAKLLRVLQEEEVDRLGGKEPTKVDVHVLATTNRDLAEAVKEGTFREDLFYRLNVIPIRLPPLRERPEDILLLADFFIEKHSSRYRKPLKKLSARSRQRFLEYSWPGNVRELENLAERAVLLSAGPELEPWDFWDEELPPAAIEPWAKGGGGGFAGEGAAGQSVAGGTAAAGTAGGTALGDGGEVPALANAGLAASGAGKADGVAEADNGDRGEFVGGDRVGVADAGDPDAEIAIDPARHTLREVERQMIMQALRQTDDNRTHAAKMLGISVRTLRNKLNEYRSQGSL